jgi:hypothetical protein
MAEDKISPELRAWLDNVIVPALVHEWIKRDAAEFKAPKKSGTSDADEDKPGPHVCRNS